jgi:uncharacterized protein YbbC (DUF1343 family)
MLEKQLQLFVGSIPVPSLLWNDLRKLARFLSDKYEGKGNYVEVSKMENYTRSIDYDLLDLPWVKPSPNMFTSMTAVATTSLFS